jgi:hypothetical protein
MGVLFALIAAGFAAVGFFAAREGGIAWIIAVAATVLAVWMSELAFRAFR